MDSLDKIIRRVKWRIAHPQEGDSMGDVFESPPSLEKIEEAEKVLGYELPPLLKRLYSEIGDGGFGPELLGIDGIISSFEQHSSQEWKERWNECPVCMVEVAYFGGESSAFVDLSSPDNNMFYFDGAFEGQVDDIEVENEADFYIKSGLIAYDLSFDEWIDRWARGYNVEMPTELEPPIESWDVGLVCAAKPEGELLKHVPKAIGSHRQVIEKILEVFPSAQFPAPDPTHLDGLIDGPDFTIKVKFGGTIGVESILLEVEGSESAVSIVTDIMRHLEADAFEVYGNKTIKSDLALIMYRKHLKKNC